MIFTKELEPINKSQIEILKLNNAIAKIRNSSEYQTLIILGWPRSLSLYRKTQTDFLANSINMQLLFSPAIALLGIYSREVKTYVYTKTCTQILKVESKFCLLYYSIYVIFWKGENLGNRKQIIGCQGPGLGEQRIRREFYGTDHNGGSIIE